MLFIAIHMIFVVSGIILLIKTKKNRIILVAAYFIRILAMFWDIYARNIFTLVGSGGDSEGFYRSAVSVSKNLGLLTQYVYGDFYTKILGVISYISFPERILLQYINVVLGLGIIIMMYKIMVYLKMNKKTVSIALIIISFFPISIIHSAILLRENVISFFAIVSLYYFIKWFNNGLTFNIMISFITLFIASSFHSGIIGLAIGYIFAILFYNHKSKKFSFRLKTVLLFGIIIILSVIVFTRYKEVFFYKFADVNEIDDVLKIANGGRGGGQYLKSLNIDNPLKLLLFSPIKMFYFLGSPLPMNWRGIGDVVALATDGIFYLYFIIYSFKKTIKNSINDPLIISIFIMLLGVIFLFGVSLANSGTAMRHRNKIIPIIIIFYSMVKDNSLINKK